MPSNNALSEYCQQTSLHGWVYVASNGGKRFWRAAWLLVVLTSVGVAGIFIYQVFKRPLKAPK